MTRQNLPLRPLLLAAVIIVDSGVVRQGERRLGAATEVSVASQVVVHREIMWLILLVCGGVMLTAEPFGATWGQPIGFGGVRFAENIVGGGVVVLREFRARLLSCRLEAVCIIIAIIYVLYRIKFWLKLLNTFARLGGLLVKSWIGFHVEWLAVCHIFCFEFKFKSSWSLIN